MLRFIFLLLLSSTSALAAESISKIQIDFTTLSATPLAQKSPQFTDLKGKIVLVDFWASWCAPCKEALPHYNKIYDKYKDQGVVFLGINEDDDNKERDSFLKEHPASFPIYADEDKKMAKKFKIAALPTLFIFDRDLKLVSISRGFNEKEVSPLEKTIQDLLKVQK